MCTRYSELTPDRLARLVSRTISSPICSQPSGERSVHLYLAESNPQIRLEWIAALDTIEGLNPTAVIAGHKRAENDDSPRIIEETRKYIRDFDRLAETTTTARVLYDEMLRLYPDRVNPGALWRSARGV